jgi:hypothetical protein
MNILFRAYCRQKDFQEKLANNLYRSGSGSGTGSESGSGRFQKSDPVKNCPDQQHCNN